MRSIRSVIITALLATALVPLLAFFVVGSGHIRQSLRQELRTGRGKIMAVVENEIESVLRNAVSDLQILKRLPSILDSEAMRKDHTTPLSHFLSKDFTALYAFDSRGYVIEATTPIRYVRENSACFREALNFNKPYLSPPFPSTSRPGHLEISIYLPVDDPRPDGIHVIRADMAFDRVWTLLDDIKVGRQEQIILVDASRNVLYHRDRYKIGTKLDATWKLMQEDNLDIATQNGVEHLSLSRSVDPVHQLQSGRPWTLLWLEPTASFYRPIANANETLAFSAGILILLTAASTFFLGRRFSVPIGKASDAAQAAAAGDLDVRLPTFGVAEIAVLGSTFNDMLAKLQDNQQNLQAKVAERTADLQLLNSELEATIAQLRQAQKMEAVGVMAGGIAHDFNNLLTAINGNLLLAKSELSDHTPPRLIQDHLDTALQAGERSARIVRQLLGFSRQSTLDAQSCDLSELARETTEMLRRTLGSRLSIRLDLEAGCGILADENLVQQILTNLCLNARDAMSENGHLHIRSRLVREGVPSSTPEGDTWVKLEVIDDGCGIPPEVMPRIFEPFFTTKAPSKGSGLGLAMCYGIVQQHGGWIECESRVGRGTCFRVFLPHHPIQYPRPVKAVEIAPPRVADPRPALETRVLLADDELPVRNVAQQVLEKNGFVVIPVSNGREAIEYLMKDTPHLVLLDGNMPVMSGQEAFKLIHQQMPELPVVICTGNADAKEGFRAADGALPSAFIEKPYAFDQLIDTVREGIREAGEKGLSLVG